jgi:Flp pilus assembly protein TadG
MRSPLRSRTRRSRQRGVAALEFALAMILFLPALFLILDWGYYYYVAITATEASRVGARQLWNQSVTNCSNTTPVTTATTLVQGSSGDAKTYMATIGMDSYTTVTASCLPTASTPVGLSNPVWTLQVKVDFPLPVPTLGLGIPRSATPGNGLFTQNLTLQGR